MILKAVPVLVSIALLVASPAYPKCIMIEGGELTLGECIEIALENNPNLYVTKARIDIAKSAIDRSRADLLPHLTGAYRYLGSGRPGEGYQTGGSAKLSLSQSIYNGGYNLSALSLSRNGLRIADEELRRARNSLILDVKSAFYNVMKSRRLLDVQRESVKLAREQLRRARGMLDAKKASRADLMKAMAQLSRSRIDSLEAERNYLTSRWNLSRVMGVWMDERVRLLDSEISPVLEDLTLDDCLKIALENHPDIRRAKAQVLASKVEIEMARSARRPKISASADYYSDGNLSAYFMVAMPIFDGMRTKASIAESKARLKIAERALEETKQLVELSVRESYAEVSFFREAVRLAEEGVKAAEENFNLAKERYELGMGTMLELMAAQVELIKAKSEKVRTLYDYKLAIAELENSLGGKTYKGEGY